MIWDDVRVDGWRMTRPELRSACPRGGEVGVDGCCWGGVGEGLRVGDGGVGAVLRGPRSSSTHTSISKTSSLKDDPPASTHQSSG